MPTFTRIIVADAHPLIHTGIRVEVAVTGTLVVVAEATSLPEAAGLCRRLQPDLLVLDTILVTDTLISSVRALRAICPPLKIIVLSVTPIAVATLVEAGVDGYVGKAAPPQTLITAMLRVAQGEFWDGTTTPTEMSDLAEHHDRSTERHSAPHRLTG